jgi:hypothetical protein
MVVAPYASGSCPINIDVSKASQEEYMRVTTRNSVMATRTIVQEGNRDDLCAYHTSNHPIGWAARNRLMRDCVHRGLVPPPPSRRRTTISTVARPETGGRDSRQRRTTVPRSSDR